VYELVVGVGLDCRRMAVGQDKDSRDKQRANGIAIQDNE
jgi:hypothetical protein